MTDNTCSFCDDPASRLLPCGHPVCDVCLQDLVADGSMCHVHPGDSEEKCSVPFSAEDVSVLDSPPTIPCCPTHTTQPMDTWCNSCGVLVCRECGHDHAIVPLDEAMRSKQATMQQRTQRLSEDIATLDQLTSALWGHKGAALRDANDEGVRDKASKAIDSDISQIEHKRDQLVVHREHLRIAHTITRMHQLEQQQIDRRLPF